MNVRGRSGKRTEERAKRMEALSPAERTKSEYILAWMGSWESRILVDMRTLRRSEVGGLRDARGWREKGKRSSISLLW